MNVDLSGLLNFSSQYPSDAFVNVAIILISPLLDWSALEIAGFSGGIVGISDDFFSEDTPSSAVLEDFDGRLELLFVLFFI